MLGSRSADSLSGLGPAPLRAGDRLPVGGTAACGTIVADVAPRAAGSLAPRSLAGGPEATELRVVAGPRDDWFTPAASNGERFKATAYILGRELRSDGVRVTIFRQVLQNGQWVDAPVSPVTVGEIENKVLSRARELREQSQANS